MPRAVILEIQENLDFQTLCCSRTVSKSWDNYETIIRMRQLLRRHAMRLWELAVVFDNFGGEPSPHFASSQAGLMALANYIGPRPKRRRR